MTASALFAVPDGQNSTSALEPKQRKQFNVSNKVPHAKFLIFFKRFFHSLFHSGPSSPSLHRVCIQALVDDQVDFGCGYKKAYVFYVLEKDMETLEKDIEAFFERFENSCKEGEEEKLTYEVDCLV